MFFVRQARGLAKQNTKVAKTAKCFIAPLMLSRNTELKSFVERKKNNNKKTEQQHNNNNNNDNNNNNNHNN